jgi:hypothetical protein
LVAAIAFLVCAVSLICGAWCFKANQRYRGAVNSSLRNELDIPESRFWYDSDYLNKFIALAGTRSTPFGKTALQLYVAPCLLWLDVGFAVGCAPFAALFWVGFLLLFPDNQTLFGIFMFFIWMAVAYGVVDVLEDLLLARLLTRGSEVGRREGRLASAVTKIKMVTITLSLVGGVAFFVFGKIFPKPR